MNRPTKPTKKVIYDHHWFKPADKCPEQDQHVVWIPPSGGAEVHGTYHGKLWFLSDGVYVYYTPSLWRPE